MYFSSLQCKARFHTDTSLIYIRCFVAKKRLGERKQTLVVFNYGSLNSVSFFKESSDNISGFQTITRVTEVLILTIKDM